MALQAFKGNEKMQQIQKPKAAFQELELNDSNMREVTFKYMRGGQPITLTVKIPDVLVVAMTDPGETRLGPLEAMRQISDFFRKYLEKDLVNVVLTGDIDVPASIFSAMAQNSYQSHALIAGVDRKISNSLFLDDKEVVPLLKLVAARMSGVEASEIEKMDIDQTTAWKSRTVTKVVQTPIVKLKQVTLMCESASSRVAREVSVPEGTTVETAREKREQKIASMPKAREALNDAFEKIGQKRGQELSQEEKDAVVGHINYTYIKNNDDRIPMTP
ncbi:MAG: hypothetical protein WC717_03515 [Candidatus Micrarchaeia archaeon]